jgi:hypothetical protein
MTLERTVGNKKKGALRQQQLPGDLLAVLSAQRAILRGEKEETTLLSTPDSS